MAARHGSKNRGCCPIRRGREDDPRNSKELGQLILAASFEKRHGAQSDQHHPMQHDLQPAVVAQQSHSFLLHCSKGKQPSANSSFKHHKT